MMAKVPLRIKFLALLLTGVLMVTATTLLLVRHTVENQIRAELINGLRGSVLTFKAFQAEREATLSHSAALLADLPTVKALMRTNDPATIQDATKETWRLSGGDLLVLAGPTGKVMAVQTAGQQITVPAVQEALSRSLNVTSEEQWWFLGGHLYEVSFQPISSGEPSDGIFLGVLAVGYEINEQVAKDISRIAGSQVAFSYGNAVVASTLKPAERPGFAQKSLDLAGVENLATKDLQLGEQRYLAAAVKLSPGAVPDVRLSVLKSYDEATARFRDLYRTLMALGILALFGQGVVAFGIFRYYAARLERLVEGVRALGKGDFGYPLDARGGDELAEVTASFVRMRDDLQQTQKKLLESERLATIGRMASSISHDLRHQLTAVVANSEFLAECGPNLEQSEEFYQEISDAVGRMTELIDSLLEFSKTRDALSPSYGSIEETMQRAVRSVQSHPNIQKLNITLSCQGDCKGWFDAKKLERAFCNLLLNACQAVPSDSGQVDVTIQETGPGVEVRVVDNGIGVPEHLRTRIFDPFVSYGKENGTGLGLTIVQKILEEHGGTVKLTNPDGGKTTFTVFIPLGSASGTDARDELPIPSSNQPVSPQ